jgi:hypothetical protein
MVKDQYDHKQNEFFKVLKSSIIEDNNKGCRTFEFLTPDIEYDNFSLEMIEVDFFKKIMESSSLILVPVNNTSNLSLYDLKIEKKIAMRLYIQVKP